MSRCFCDSKWRCDLPHVTLFFARRSNKLVKVYSSSTFWSAQSLSQKPLNFLWLNFLSIVLQCWHLILGGDIFTRVLESARTNTTKVFQNSVTHALETVKLLFGMICSRLCASGNLSNIISVALSVESSVQLISWPLLLKILKPWCFPQFEKIIIYCDTLN